MVSVLSPVLIVAPRNGFCLFISPVCKACELHNTSASGYILRIHVRNVDWVKRVDTRRRGSSHIYILGII